MKNAKLADNCIVGRAALVFFGGRLVGLRVIFI